MRHPKRFCVPCSSLQWLTVRKHEKYAMYHCRNCGEEICRAGDGSQSHATQQIKNLDVSSIPEDVAEGRNLLNLACENPDMLSDEHRIWLPEENAGERETWGRVVTVSLALLTPRQREVAEAVQQHNGQREAAKVLGITQQAVSRIMHQIRKKLQADGCISDRSPLKGKEPK